MKAVASAVMMQDENENNNIIDTINKICKTKKKVTTNSIPIRFSSDDEEAEILKDISKSINKMSSLKIDKFSEKATKKSVLDQY
ncbi:unnamed protein product [Rotaria socialis]